MREHCWQTWHDRRTMQRLTRLPHAELQIIISQMRRLSPACQQRILEGLPAWQHDILQAALKHRRHRTAPR
jgi:hypothetical protein